MPLSFLLHLPLLLSVLLFYTEPIKNKKNFQELDLFFFYSFSFICYLPQCILVLFVSLYINFRKTRERGKKTSRGRKTTSLGNKQLFSLGWCRAVMNSTTSLSLIRPPLVSLWNAPPSWGSQRGLRLPTPHHHLPVLLHFHPPPPDGYHPHPAAPLVTILFSVEFHQKKALAVKLQSCRV